MNTLRQLHKELNVKQTLKIYVNNTNKKYRQNWTADTQLGDTTYLIVKLNTLSKHRKHTEQFELLHELIIDQQQKKATETRLNVAKTQLAQEKARSERATEIVAKDSLKNSYIETLKEFAYFATKGMKNQRTDEFISSIGIKYAEYINASGIEKIFKDRVKWFESELTK